MDVPSQVYLGKFRIPECLAVLRRLGLATHGRKAELIDRIQQHLGAHAPTSSKHKEAVQVITAVYIKAFGGPPAGATAPSDRHTAPMARDNWQGAYAGQPSNGSLQQNYYPSAPLPFVPGPNNPSAQYPYNHSNGATAMHGSVRTQQQPYNGRTADVSPQYQTAHAYRSPPLPPLPAQTYNSPAPYRGAPSGAAGAANGIPGQAASPVACVCLRNNAYSEDMVKCAACGRLQHAFCMTLKQPSQLTNEERAAHTCEVCRAELANPFWKTLEWIVPHTGNEVGKITRMSPMRQLPSAQHPHDSHRRSVSLRFKLTNEQAAIIAQARKAVGISERIELVSLNARDTTTTPNRYHFPQNCVATFNNDRTSTRPCRQLGANRPLRASGRDAPLDVTSHVSRSHENTIVLQCIEDSDNYFFGLRITKQRSMEELKATMLMKEETLAEARQRMASAVCSGGDDEFSVGNVSVSLKCPMSCMRIDTAARFNSLGPLNIFDLDNFLETASRNLKWQCPITQKDVTIKDLRPDIYMNRVLRHLQTRDDVDEVEIDAQGRWRIDKNDQWHDIEEPVPEPLPRRAEKTETTSDDATEDVKPPASKRQAPSNGVTDWPNPAPGPAAVPAGGAGEVFDLLSSDDEGHCAADGAAAAPALMQHVVDGSGPWMRRDTGAAERMGAAGSLFTMPWLDNALEARASAPAHAPAGLETVTALDAVAASRAWPCCPRTGRAEAWAAQLMSSPCSQRSSLPYSSGPSARRAPFAYEHTASPPAGGGYHAHPAGASMARRTSGTVSPVSDSDRSRAAAVLDSDVSETFHPRSSLDTHRSLAAARPVSIEDELRAWLDDDLDDHFGSNAL